MSTKYVRHLGGSLVDATIRTICPRCGHVELDIVDIDLEITVGAAEGRYRFECPGCGDMHHRPASGRVVSVLIAAGVRHDIVADTNSITEDEISDFTAALDNEDWTGEAGSSE